MRAWGIALLIGSVITLAWLHFCPTYSVSGANATLVTKSVFVESGQRFEHLDAVTFFGGLIAVWGAIAGCCLLRKEIAATLAGAYEPNPPKSSAALASTVNALRPSEGNSSGA